MRHIPSEKTLRLMLSDALKKALPHREADIFDVIDRVKNLRLLLVRWRDKEIKSQEMLEEADRILGGFGVEYIRSEKDGMYEAHGAYYVNMGETYAPTLLLDLDRARVWVTSWGDWVEAEERQGKRFP